MGRLSGRILAVLLCCILLMLAACGTGTQGREGEQGSGGELLSVEKGRYVEEMLPLPEGLEWILTLQRMNEDTFYMLAADSYYGGPWHVYFSEDAGRTWREQPYAWLDVLNAQDVKSAAFTDEGDLYVVYLDLEAASEMDDSLEDIDFLEEYAKYCGVYYGDREQLTPLDFDLNEGWHTPSPPLMITESGYFAVGNYYDLNVFGADGSVRQQMATNSMVTVGSVYVEGDTLTLIDSNEIAVYDLRSGEKADSLPYAMSSSYPMPAIAPQLDGTGVYVCERSGLYRVLADGSLTEQLIDGSLATFGLPSVNLQQLFAFSDDTFLALCSSDSGYGLYHYRYDPDIDRVPSNLLSVYSLEESKTLRQAVGLFQQQNPDLLVRYTVGVTGEDGVTVADALRTLSTEILAGQGPDVLMLDGMPVDSYIEQGILMDLSDLLDNAIASETYIEQVAETWRRDGALYAIPTRFSVPLIGGEDMGDIQNLSGLVDWLELHDTVIGAESETLIDRFYDVCSPGWFGAGGALDEAVFREDLQNLRRLAQRIDNAPGYVVATHSFISDAAWYNGGYHDLMFSTMHALRDYSYILGSFREQGAGELRLFPAEIGGVYVPGVVLGVTTTGNQQQTAQDLVRFVLSQEQQQANFDEGMAVNRAALALTAQEELSLGSLGFSFNDPAYGPVDGTRLDQAQPTPEEYSALLDLLEQAGTPSVNNAVIQRMVLEETEGYLTGSRSLDEVVSSLTQKLNIYLAE